MKAYRLSVNLKLGLIIFAVLIAVASLAYTSHLVGRLKAREQASVRIWANAYKALSQSSQLNPYQDQLILLDRWLAAQPTGGGPGGGLTREQRQAFRDAVVWAQTMPTDDLTNFVMDQVILPNDFDVPAIVTDSTTGQPTIWENISVREENLTRRDTLRLIERAAEMAEGYPPIPIELSGNEKLFVNYDESRLIRELRLYPYLQIFFVSLFILVGYLGFSYVRRSEQSNLWVGMAREAAHQLGTPISSLMGWLELLRSDALDDDARQDAYAEIEKDLERLRRVTNRFNDIGSMPRLDPTPIAPFITNTADYMRRRFPQRGNVRLSVDVPPELQAPVNAELFEWVIENLLKNALDAIEKESGHIDVAAHRENGHVVIEVRDNGKGIDRRQWKNIFRPGYSTKKRGWGLGLSLAKRIVEDYHGGTLSLAQSKVGQGTTFRIQLPASNGAVGERKK